MATSEVETTEVSEAQECDPVLEHVVGQVSNGHSIFLTGGAGVGKTYTTRKFLELCEDRGISVLQCGTTGVSALQLPGGQTVHSTLGLPVDFPDDYAITRRALEKFLYRRGFRGAKNRQVVEDCQNADVLLIDEISMCSAYMMDAIDIMLRMYRKTNEPLGGLVLFAIGDFLQLPPVYNSRQNSAPPSQKEFAFDSKIWMAIKPDVILLHGSKRQLNSEFSSLLSKIRMGNPLTIAEQNLLRARCVRSDDDIPQNALYIAHRRTKVRDMNERCLKKLTERNSSVVTRKYDFPMTSVRSNQTDASASLLKDLTTTLRDNLYLDGSASSQCQTFVQGQRVMFIINFRDYVNGDTGTIMEFVELKTQSAGQQSKNKFYDLNELSPGRDYKTCTKSGKARRTLKGMGRDIFPVVKFDRTQKQVVVGSFNFSRETRGSSRKLTAAAECIPLICCYACTIHKVQGCTISVPLALDCEDADWQHAIFYVGLSRATSLDNVYLKNYRNKYRCNQKAKYYYEMGYANSVGKLTMQESIDRGAFSWTPVSYQATQGQRNERSPGTSMKLVVDSLDELNKELEQESAENAADKDVVKLNNTRRAEDWKLSIAKISHPRDCYEDDESDMLAPVLEHLADKYKRKRQLLWDSLDNFKKRRMTDEKDDE